MKALYRSESIPEKRPLEGNTGLWYDKFCNTWEPGWHKGLGDTGKRKWIGSVTDKPVGDLQQLQDALLRTVGFLKSFGQTPLLLQNTYAFATGLGREHPVENGFSWHHLLGVPYLPGSSLKGLVRSWATHWAEPEPEPAVLNRIFGPRKDVAHEDPKVGSVIFLDALPTEPVTLMADIMTPHYSDYYQSTGGKISPPADWNDPKPIPFLVVAPAQTFVFSILPRDTKNLSDCTKVVDWMLEALANLGAGAKTAVGYGRFSEDATKRDILMKHFANTIGAEKEKQQAEALLAQKTEGKSELFRDLYTTAVKNSWLENVGKDSFVQQGVIEAWLDRLESMPDHDSIQLLAKLLNQHFPMLLANPEAIKGKMGKPAFKPRQRDIAKKFLTISKG